MRITLSNREPPQRHLQDEIVAEWQASSLRKSQVQRLVPSINPALLCRYLNGDRSAFLRERSAEWLLSVLRSAPKGPKESR